MSYQVLFTDHTFDSLDIEREILGEIDAEVIDGETRDEPLAALVGDVDGLIVMYDEIDDDLVASMSECQVITRTGIGVDNVDVDAASERGIVVTNVPDYCIAEVADHTLALLLALERKIVFYDDHVSEGEWDVAAGRPMHRLGEQTLGLVAFGDIARAVSDRAQAFGMDVLAHDPYLDDAEIRESGVTPVDSLETLLDRSDAISVHAPLTDETEGMIGADELSRLDDSAVVVNAARGGIVDERALADALDRERIAGAGLDVLSEEPLPADHPLRDVAGAIVTPHAAWNSEESVVELREKAARDVRAVLGGERPAYPVNEAVLD